VTAAVEFKNVNKSFGSCHASQSLSFTVEAGTIHGIVGENGAGKSTAMNLLFGIHHIDSGEILVHGKTVHFKSPIEAMSSGIGMVHQHFMLAEPLSALDNILLQQNGAAFDVLRREEERQRLLELARRYGFDVDLDARVEDLSVGAQQRLEILKVLSQNSEIIILDEPTAVLTPQEVTELFKNLRDLRTQGRTIIIITHKLKEVMSLTDNVTVFRANKVVANRKTSATDPQELAELMVGQRLQTPSARTTQVDYSRKVLSLKNVSARLSNHHIENVHLELHSSEILGIAGVEGNGQDVLIRTLLDQKSLNKKSFTGDVHFQSLGKHTMVKGLFPEDRLRFGALSERPAYENFILGRHRDPEFSRWGFLRLKNIMKRTLAAMQMFDVRPADEKYKFGSLSGGNQQKLVVARELQNKVDFLLAAQPTRGVDIGAIEFIHEQIRKSRDEGAGVLLISSELDELMTLSDRILVIYKGRIVGEYLKADFNEITIGKAMGGLS
jgi:ABC-type uncharacterized transport systems, ATPase components